MAELVLRHRLAQEGLAGAVTVDSAGIGAWHVGEPADPRTVTTLAAHGYPTAHVARQWQPDWFAERDLVIALDEEHARELRLGAPDSAATDKVVLLREFDPASDDDDLDVPDPYYGGSRGFDEVLAHGRGRGRGPGRAHPRGARAGRRRRHGPRRRSTSAGQRRGGPG